MRERIQSKLNDKSKMVILLVLITIFTIIYLLLNFSRSSQSGFISLDKDKPMDEFVQKVLHLTKDDNTGFLEYCEFNLQNIVIFLLIKITGSVQLAFNLYYVISFFLVSLSVYFLLKKLNFTFVTSVFLSVLAMLLPFHTDRGQGQILTSNFFMVPIYFGMIYDLYFKKDTDIDLKRYMILLALAPIIDLRLSYMLIILMVVLGLSRMNLNTIKQTFICILPMLIFSIIISIMTNDKGIEMLSVMEQANSDGLRPLDMLVPVRYHVVGRLMNFRSDYDASFNANGESGLNSMGILLSIGFLYSLAILLLGKRNQDKLFEKWLGFINVNVIVFASIGGFCVYLEYIGIRVEYWNRMGIFIIITSIIIVAELIDKVKEIVNARFGRYVSLLLFAGIEVMAILDILLRRWMFF